VDNFAQGYGFTIVVTVVMLEGEPPPDTVNVAVTLDGALVAIATSIVMLLRLCPGAKVRVVVQVSVLRVQDHAEPPLIDPGVSELARLAVTVTVPLVAEVPLLVTVIVY